MEPWDEQALREINNLDAARLAIRGALSTIRGLQDANTALKGQLQDETSRRKHFETRLTELETQLGQWQKRGEGWETERVQFESKMDSWKHEVRMEVRAEEKARIDEDRRLTEEMISTLRSELIAMAKSHSGKEEAWNELCAQLEKRDQEILNLRRAKEEALDLARHEIDLIEQVRLARDREISTSVQSLESQLTNRDNEIASLRRANDEAQRALEQLGKDQELRLKAREESLVKATALKEKDLIERYHRRETELQTQWSELEQGLWAKAKQSRAQLDEAVQKQFSERARQLADRAQEIDDLLAKRKAEMDDDFAKRCAMSEAQYAENERRLVNSWEEKARRLETKVRGELDAERAALRDEWSQRGRTLESEHSERLRQVSDRQVELEREFKHKAARLLEEAASKDGERVRTQDEFVALKTAELERLYSEKLSALTETRLGQEESTRQREERRESEHSARSAALIEEYEKKRIELVEEQRRAVGAESAALAAQYEQRQRILDQEYRAKVAETECAARTNAEQFEGWKVTQREEYLRKEKDLDTRWSSRESELVQRYETALEEQRRTFAAECAAARDAADLHRRRAEIEFAQREQALKAEFERTIIELRNEHVRDQAGRQAAHESRASELRQNMDAQLRLAREKSLEDQSRERAKLQNEINRLSESLNLARGEGERASSASSARIKSLEARLSTLEIEASSLREQLIDRDRLRDVERTRAFEEARLASATELARALEESEKQATAALNARSAELERAIGARRRALDETAAMRESALEDRERRLNEEAQHRTQQQRKTND